MNKATFIFIVLIYLINSSIISAQSLEPRLYSNAPTDLNFLVLGLGHSEGALASTPELDLKDPNLMLEVGVLAYARGLNFFGKSAKFNITIPMVKMHGDAAVNGVYRTKDVTGLADIKARFSVNLFGSPALKLKDFSTYKQDTIIGVSLQVTAPTGKYEADKLLNIGRNIWAAKLGTGVSKALGSFVVELLADAEFYTQNSSYLSSKTKKIDPVYSIQTHLIYNIQRGMWLALNLNYYWGGNSFIDGVDKETELSNSRMGGVFAMPINKTNSVKLTYSDGVSVRTGTNFRSGMLSWQYRFGGGI